MKTISLILFLFLITTIGNSQSLSPTVFASAGGYSSAGGASLSWTVGEPFTKTLQGGNNMLTQGFQQSFFINLSLKMFIQGFYTSGGFMQNGGAGCLNILPIDDPMYSPDPEDVDDVTVTAMNANTYLPVESQIGRLKTNGDLSVTFTGAAAVGGPYYLQLLHRNLVETWSKNPVALLPVSNYDFTTASTQAYDDGFTLPMKLVSSSPQRWAMYNGDINQDGGIDSQDMTMEEGAANDGLFGYYPTDLNGDGASDSVDMTIIEDNSNAGIFESHP